MKKEEIKSAMEVLDMFLMKCTTEEVQNVYKVLEEQGFPMNVNFHLIKEDSRGEKYKHLVKNYYVTFKFTVQKDGELYVEYYNIYFRNTLKLLKYLSMKKMVIYKPKLTKAKEYVKLYSFEDDGVLDNTQVVEEDIINE